MTPISASEAFAKSKGFVEKSADGRDADDINFSLTIARVFDIIRAETQTGKTQTVFIAPLFVMDGCLTEPIKLAKQVKAHLVGLGYDVQRDDESLTISWYKEEPKPAAKPVPSWQARKPPAKPPPKPPAKPPVKAPARAPGRPPAFAKR